MKQKIKRPLFEFQNVGDPEYSVLIEDILSVASADTIIIKMDIEGYECKVS
jgi:hypothetical protein